MMSCQKESIQGSNEESGEVRRGGMDRRGGWDGEGRGEGNKRPVLRGMGVEAGVKLLGREGLEQWNGSRRIEADLESFLKGCGDVCGSQAGIPPSFQQAEGQVFGRAEALREIPFQEVRLVEKLGEQMSDLQEEVKDLG